MKRRRVLAVLGLVLAAAAAGASAADRAPPATTTAAPTGSGPAEERAGAGPKPRLAAWRESARRPADVPPTALVRAARRDRGAAEKRRAASRPAKPEPVEIVWHAPGSN